MTEDFISSGYRSTTTRIYKSLTETVSQIGGMNTIALLIFSFATWSYLRIQKREILVDQIFGFLKQTKNNANMIEPSTQSCGQNESDSEKPQVTKKSLGELREQAYSFITESLDVTKLVRDLNTVKFLAMLLLEKSQARLLHPAVLNSHLCSKATEEANENRSTKTLNFAVATGELGLIMQQDLHSLEERMTDRQNLAIPNSDDASDKADYLLKSLLMPERQLQVWDIDRPSLSSSLRFSRKVEDDSGNLKEEKEIFPYNSLESKQPLFHSPPILASPKKVPMMSKLQSKIKQQNDLNSFKVKTKR